MNDSQRDQIQQQAAAAGLMGTAIVDVHPSQGFLRLKVKLSPPEKLPEFMRGYGNVLVMTLGMLNIQAKLHIEEAGEG